MVSNVIVPNDYPDLDPNKKYLFIHPKDGLKDQIESIIQEFKDKLEQIKVDEPEFKFVVFVDAPVFDAEGVEHPVCTYLGKQIRMYQLHEVNIGCSVYGKIIESTVEEK